MRIAFIADVHSNLHALQAVMSRIDQLGVDSIACAGDIVGYGAFPNECCKLVAENADNCVYGNHDQAALESSTAGMNPHAAEALRWTARRLDDDSSEFLASLPFDTMIFAGQTRGAVFHGSPESVGEYLYQGSFGEEILQTAEANLVVLGHTHVPFFVRFKRGLVINPGSVGQPRDGDPRASFALLDTSTNECEVLRVEYDIRGAAEAILAQGLPKFLADRLFRGT